MSALAGRISSWPYGAASLPVTSSRAPRWYVAASARHVHDQAGGRVTDRQEGGRPEPALLGGHDAGGAHHRSRPGSSGRRRVGSSQGEGRRGGRRRSASGSAWASPVGRRGSDRVGVGVGVGAVGGSRRRVSVGVGVGLGVGAGASSSSPARVAWIRYPAVPVPELSRCPSGPLIVATIPDARVSPSAAAGPMTARTVPEPSSRVTPRPSVSWSGAPMIVPLTRTRRPSNGSPAAPVSIATAAGRSETGPTHQGRLRDPQRPLGEPARDGAFDGHRGPGRPRADHRGVEIERDPARRVLDEPAVARFEGAERRGQDALDRDDGAVGQARASAIGRGVGVGVASASASAWAVSESASGSASASGVGVAASAVGVGVGVESRSASVSPSASASASGRVGSRDGVGVGRRRRVGDGTRASAGAAVDRRRRGPRGRHGRRAQTLRRRRTLDEPIADVVVRVGPVPGQAAWRALEARPGGWRRGRGPLDERAARVTPADGVDRRRRRRRGARSRRRSPRTRSNTSHRPRRRRRPRRSRSGCACPARGSSPSSRSPCA